MVWITCFSSKDWDWLTVPIEFQDVSADDYPYVNEYNRLLASAQTNADTDEGYDAFVAANEYRTANQEHIDKYVLDAKKLNILIALVINAYMFASKYIKFKRKDYSKIQT